MQELEKQPEEKGFFDKALDYLKGFGMRLVVHGASLLCAAVIADASVGSYVFLGSYIGLICLFSREMTLNTKWLMPVSLGAVQGLIALGLGLPLYQCIFWAGFQSYVQRTISKRFEMGFEWLVAAFILPVALDSLLSFPNIFYLVVSFACLGLGGGLFWKFYMAKKERKISYEQKSNTKENTSTVVEPDLDPFEVYKAQIAKLRVKQILLPKKLQTSVQALAKSAEGILLCMQEDIRDQDAGKRFLNRYLPATHSVLDNYQKHCKDVANNPQIAEAIQQSEDILIRLEQVFAQEREHLLRNNIDDFSADLGVLDKMLKMKGH